MNSVPDRITTLIFDLGGVIVDLAPEKTLTGFAELANLPVSEILKMFSAHSAFNDYETGKIGAEEFRNEVRSMVQVQVSDSEIDRCWNAMLVDLPEEKLNLLTRLKKHFTTLALSNTNSIHLAYINQVMLGGGNLDDYFHYAHYSHTIGLRKPDPAIYEYILSRHNLIPEQTFFMDDNPDNIAAAGALGIKTLQIEHPNRVTDLFKNYE